MADIAAIEINGKRLCCQVDVAGRHIWLDDTRKNQHWEWAANVSLEATRNDKETRDRVFVTALKDSLADVDRPCLLRRVRLYRKYVIATTKNVQNFQVALKQELAADRAHRFRTIVKCCSVVCGTAAAFLLLARPSKGG